MNARKNALALGVVTLVGVALRLAMLETLPLVVTVDGSRYPEGRGYLVWAYEIFERAEFAGPTLRTPGYPALVASAFAIGGVRDDSVLWLQHLEGLATVALLTLVAARLAGPWVALATGTLAALDPWHLLFAHYALSESSMVFAVVATAAALLLPRTRSNAQGVAVGLLAGASCLIRPTAQLLVPFFAAAYLLSGPRQPRRLVGPALSLALGLLLSLGPWLAFNASRGIHGLAVQGGHLLFLSMAYHRLLDARDIPSAAPEAVRDGFDRMLAARPEQGATDRFLAVCRSSGLSFEQREEWSRRSLARAPGRYLLGVWHSLLGLLDLGRPGRPPIRDELLGFVALSTTEGWRTGLASVDLPGAAKASPSRRRDPPRLLRAGVVRYFESASEARGLPQLPLALLAGLALGVCLWRRRLPEAAVLAGSLAFVAGHALILQPWQRYALPSELLWYLALPILFGCFRTDVWPHTARADGSTPPHRRAGSLGNAATGRHETRASDRRAADPHIARAATHGMGQ